MGGRSSDGLRMLTVLGERTRECYVLRTDQARGQLFRTRLALLRRLLQLARRTPEVPVNRATKVVETPVTKSRGSPLAGETLPYQIEGCLHLQFVVKISRRHTSLPDKITVEGGGRNIQVIAESRNRLLTV